MKTGVGILYKKLSMKYEFCKNQCTKDIYYLRAKMNNHPTFCTFSLIWIKFSIQHLGMKLFRVFRFWQNQCAKGCTFMRGMNITTFMQHSSEHLILTSHGQDESTLLKHRLGRLLLLFVISLFCSSEIITPRISYVRINNIWNQTSNTIIQCLYGQSFRPGINIQQLQKNNTYRKDG